MVLLLLRVIPSIGVFNCFKCPITWKSWSGYLGRHSAINNHLGHLVCSLTWTATVARLSRDPNFVACFTDNVSSSINQTLLFRELVWDILTRNSCLALWNVGYAIAIKDLSILTRTRCHAIDIYHKILVFVLK